VSTFLATLFELFLPEESAGYKDPNEDRTVNDAKEYVMRTGTFFAVQVCCDQ
jgi:hypothetical protein